MVAAIIPVDLSTFEARPAAGQKQRAQRASRQLGVGELVVGRTGKLQRQRLLPGREHVDREP